MLTTTYRILLDESSYIDRKGFPFSDNGTIEYLPSPLLTIDIKSYFDPVDLFIQNYSNNRICSIWIKRGKRWDPNVDSRLLRYTLIPKN